MFMPESIPEVLEVLPPEPAPSPWLPIVSALKQAPMQWRRITGPAADTVAVTNITRGVLAAFRPAGCYEAVRRDGELFVRYLGTLEDIDRRVGELKGGLG